MRFFKEHLDNIVRLIVFQVGIAIFSFFLYTAAGAISSDNTTSLGIKVGISVFSIVFYLTLIHTMMWEEGAKDKIRVQSGRSKKTAFKGMGIAFCANIFNFVITGIALISMATYMLGGSEWLKTVFGFMNLIFRMLLSMYLGIIQIICNPLAASEDLYFLMQTVCFFAFPVISIIGAHISYSLGYAERRIFGFLDVNNKNKKK